MVNFSNSKLMFKLYLKDEGVSLTATPDNSSSASSAGKVQVEVEHEDIHKLRDSQVCQ